MEPSLIGYMITLHRFKVNGASGMPRGDSTRTLYKQKFQVMEMEKDKDMSAWMNVWAQGINHPDFWIACKNSF